MNRAPIVITATAAGLGLVLSFHTRTSRQGVAVSPPAPTTAPAPSTTVPGQAESSTTAPPSTTAPAAVRTATSPDISYRYGDIELEVTEKSGRLTDVQVLREDATDRRSEDINSQAIPMLTQEALAAGSANIDGVSGATFTSEAYAQALQSALDQLRA